MRDYGLFINDILVSIDKIQEYSNDIAYELFPPGL